MTRIRIDPDQQRTLNAARRNLQRDGRPMNGGLHVTMEVHCALCEKAALGLPHPSMAAERELRTDGWAKVQGLWVCDEHAGRS
jgi:hypothetical protein